MACRLKHVKLPQLPHGARHGLTSDAEEPRELAMPEQLRNRNPPRSFRHGHQPQERATEALNDVLEDQGFDLRVRSDETGCQEIQELLQEVRTSRQTLEELCASRADDGRGLQGRCPIGVDVIAKAHLAEHVGGTEEFEREFITTARHRRLLDKSGADQEEAIGCVAWPKELFRGANMSYGSAKEFGTERAPHELCEIQAACVMADSAHDIGICMSHHWVQRIRLLVSG